MLRKQRILSMTGTDHIEIIEKNHMEIPWHDYTNADSNALICDADLIEKASVIGRVGLKLNNFKEMMQLSDYLKRQNLVEQFATYGANHGLQRRNLMIQKSHKLLDRYINSRIIYNMLNEEGWTQYLNQDDPVIKKALEVFRNGESFPKKPEANQEETKKQKVAQARNSVPYMPLNNNMNIVVRC